MFRVRMLAVLRQLEDGEFEKASSPLLYPYSCAQGGACVCHFSLCACCLFVCVGRMLLVGFPHALRAAQRQARGMGSWLGGGADGVAGRLIGC